ncbi:MAG: hypothetical protein IBX57_01005 [Gammaproteobacteria bacterium]|nr:hypothetical protein [Gammaproteobacteria bacterium]
MFILKGFIGYQELTDNNPGAIHPIGEISKDSLTYAIETGYYKDLNYPGVELHTFNSHIEGQGKVEVPQNYVEFCLNLGLFILTKAKDGTFTADRTGVEQWIVGETMGQAHSIELGPLVTDGNIWVPEWLSFRLVGEDNYVKLWLVDEAFSTQYDIYEYKVVAPIENIDDFFKDSATVASLIAENNTKRLMERVVETRDKDPYTLLFTNEYEWIDPDPLGEAILTNWTVLVYGRAGGENDKVRMGLIDWILANSNYTREQWLDRFPDLFTPVEFIITPLWHQYAIPNQTVQAGFNSPVITIQRAREIAEVTCVGTGYAPAQIIENTTIATAPSTTMGFLATGSAVNRNGISRFNEMFPDYIDVPIGTSDFARMSERTQAFVLKFAELLQVAQEMDTYTSVPFGYSRVFREGNMYALVEFENVQYIMVTRKSLVDSLGIETPYMPEFDNGEEFTEDTTTG